MTNRELPTDFRIIFEPVQEQDIQALEVILRQHVRDSQTGEVIEDEISNIKEYMQGGKDGFGRTRTYIIAKDQTGRVLGCMAYSLPEPDMVRHFHLENPDEYIELLNAFVTAEVFRGGGVGKRLLAHICEAGRQAGKKALFILSGPRYQASWGFYDKHADENCGFIYDKYGPGRDGNTWRINLEQNDDR